MIRLHWLPCTSKPSPTGTRPPPSSCARAGARTAKSGNAPSPTSPSGPREKSTPCADCSRTNRWSGVTTPSHRALSPPWPCRGGAGDAAHTAPGPAHRPRAFPAARARAGDGRCAHPRPRLEAGHRPGAGRGHRARFARRRRWVSGRWTRTTCTHRWHWLLRAPGPHRAGLGETPSRGRHVGALRPDVGMDGGTDLPAGQARSFARRQAGQAANRVRARDGCPVSVEVFAGNTADPSTVGAQVGKLRQRFGLSRVVLVGDRGMLTEARIREEVEPAWTGSARCGGRPSARWWSPRCNCRCSRARLGGGHERCLPRRASDGVPQSAAGRGAGEEARGVARRHRGGARTHCRGDAAREAAPERREQDWGAGGQGHRPVQDGQALRVVHRREGGLAYRRNASSIAAEAALDGLYVDAYQRARDHA